MTPILTTVLVTYNLPEDSQLSLIKTLMEAPIWVEILVIDNHSANAFKSSFKNKIEMHPRIRFIEEKQNRGFGAACNLGASLAQAPVLFFLNPDCYFDPPMWSRVLREALAIQEGKVDVVTPVVMRANQNQVDTVGERLYLGGGVVKLAEGLPLEFVQAHPSQFKNEFAQYKAGPSGCAFLIERRLFLKHQFDETYFLLKEDTDLSIRLLQDRAHIRMAEDLIIQHRVSQVVNTLGSYKSYLAIRNTYYNYFKNSSFLELLLNSPFILVQSALLLAYHSIVKKNPRSAILGFCAGMRHGVPKLNQTKRFYTTQFLALHSPFSSWLRRFTQLYAKDMA